MKKLLKLFWLNTAYISDIGNTCLCRFIGCRAVYKQYLRYDYLNFDRCGGLFFSQGRISIHNLNRKAGQLRECQKTIRNAIIGLVIVLGASLFVSVLSNSFNQVSQSTNSGVINISQIETVKPTDGLTQVLIDAVSGFMQNIVQSATKPIVDGIIGYLTSTPDLLSNSVILKFWTVILGITDSLFVLVVALLGLHFMSAGALGFEEIELRHMLPRIGWLSLEPMFRCS